MPSSLPIYPRPETGIYCFHTSIAGKQFKKSLHTKDKTEAIIRAIPLYELVLRIRSNMSNDDWKNNIRKLEIDTSRGIFKTDGSQEDNDALLKAIAMLTGSGYQAPRQQVLTSDAVESLACVVPTNKKGLTIREVLDKLLLFKKLEVRTVQQYKTNIEEFAVFVKNCDIQKILISDIVRYQEHLLVDKKNSHRTADNKISVLKSFFNFAIDKGYYFEKNPCQGQGLLSKKQKDQSTYSIFEDNEIIQIFTNELFKREYDRDKDFYFSCLITLISGLRASEITALKKTNLFFSDEGIPYIKLFVAKTEAGKREIPLPDCDLTKEFFAYAEKSQQPESKIFRYREREGKGAGNALGKKFARLLTATKTHRDKLVFHSLRKYFNDYLKKNKITWEARTQVLGHENEDINNKIYSSDFTIKELHEMIDPLQKKILEKINQS